MKKKLLLFCMLFLLTGCDAVYRAEIKNGKVLESTNFYASSGDIVENNADMFNNPNGDGKTENELVDDYYNQDYLAYYNRLDSSVYYQKEKITYEDRSGIRLSYSYSLADYKDSSLIHYCFDDVNIENGNEYYIINLKNSEKCFTQDIYQKLDSVNIQIVSNGVIEHNADSVNDSLYTWILTKESPNKEVYLKIKSSSSTDFFTGTMIAIFVVVVCGIVSFFGVSKLMEYRSREKKW